MDSEDSGGEDSRESGVELGDLNRKLDEHDYPTSTDELLAAYGDYEIELPDGSETLSEVLSPMADDSFDSPEAVRQAIYNMVGAEAVGRKGYTDRGAGNGDMPGDQPTNESF